MVVAINRFVCSRTGASGLEMLGKRNRDMIQRHRYNTETQDSNGRATQWTLNTEFTLNFHMLLCLKTKREKNAKFYFNMTQRITSTVTCFKYKYKALIKLAKLLIYWAGYSMNTH